MTTPHALYPTLRSPIRRVLLIAPAGKITLTKEGSRERKLAVPPLGLAYLAAQLQLLDVQVEILDALIEGYQQERVVGRTIYYGLDDAAIRRKLEAYKPDMIGISCPFSNRAQDVLKLAKMAKQTCPEAHLVMGGQHPSGMPEMVLDPHVDYLLFGESDLALPRLIRAINGGHPLDRVGQLIYKTTAGFHQVEDYQPPLVEDLPWPAWDKVDLQRYWQAGLADYEVHEGEKRFMIMLTSRGCPHNCGFCTAPMTSRRHYRLREIDDVMAEIHHNRARYNPDEIHFWDDNFFIHRKRVKTLLRRVIRETPDLRYQVPSGGEVNAFDDEMIELMAEAGFNKIFLAVESANAEVQDRMVAKRVNLDRIEKIVEKCQKAGLITEGVFMVGFPGETKEQIDHTFQRATQYGFDRLSFSIVNPLPGTALYRQCLEEKLFHDDFDGFDIRWSKENIRLEGVERGYIARRRREVWQDYMSKRIDIQQYERQNTKRHRIFGDDV
ncbi:MAG: B12-binding domain-containing radical SAM protein [Magnetococcales bacterium]|nr:B12-binding domain-containing radical SAM protein [Magnetococcales bacterium]